MTTEFHPGRRSSRSRPTWREGSYSSRPRGAAAGPQAAAVPRAPLLSSRVLGAGRLLAPANNWEMSPGVLGKDGALSGKVVPTALCSDCFISKLKAPKKLFGEPMWS